MANKGYIADVVIDRPMAPPDDRWKRIGKIYWGGDDHHYAKIHLFSIPMTQKFVAFLNKGVQHPPYLEGDITVPGFGMTCPDTGKVKHTTEWVGYINSSQTATGTTVYVGSFELLPMSLIHKAASDEREAIWLTIRLK